MGAAIKLVAAVAAVIVAAGVGAMPAMAAGLTHVDYDLDGSAPVPASLGRLDLYTSPGSGPTDRRPVVVYVHGGGWRKGDKSNQIADKARLFTGAGYVFASVNYRLSPDPIDPSYPAGRVRFPDQPDDVGEAIGWLDRNVASFGGDPRRIVLIGHSAGAQIVGLASTDPRYVDRWGVDPRHLVATVPLDGEYDIAERVATGTPRSRALFYNAFATPAENAVDGSWDRASPIRWAGPADPPFLIVTQERSPARTARSREMAAALGNGSTVLAVPYDHAGINAAVGSVDDPAGETAAIMAFVKGAIERSRPSAVRWLHRPPARIRIRHRGDRASVRYRFAAEQGAQRLECRLDAASFRRCSSPARYRVRHGFHAFRVRAVSSNGATGPVATDRFRVVVR